jgi:hypothetical protein
MTEQEYDISLKDLNLEIEKYEDRLHTANMNQRNLFFMAVKRQSEEYLRVLKSYRNQKYGSNE